MGGESEVEGIDEDDYCEECDCADEEGRRGRGGCGDYDDYGREDYEAKGGGRLGRVRTK